MGVLVRCGVVALVASAVACGSRSSAPPADVTIAPGVTQQLGSPAAANATPVLASSGTGLVAVWTATEHGQTDVYAASSDDGGTTFRPPVRVNDSPGEAHVYGEDPPRVAIDHADVAHAPTTIVVAWPSDRGKHLGLRSARSVDGGRTFLPSVSIGDDAVQGERGFQSITFGPDHVLRAAWLDGRRDPGTPPHANAGDDWDPMHLMYASSGGATPWNAETRLASGVCGCCKTAIVVGPEGTVYVAFRNIYPGSLRDISFAMSRDGGRTFGAPARISEDHWALNACPDDGPTMQLDSSGTIHIVWPTLVQASQPAIRLFHVSTRDGKSFTKRQEIPTAGSLKPAHPQLVADPCGTLTLVWDEGQATTHRAFLRRLKPLSSGDVQAGEMQIVSGDLPAVYPVVAATPDGVMAAWAETGNDNRSRVSVRQVMFRSSCSAEAR